MKRIIVISLFSSLIITNAVSQQNDQNWGIKFSGFVKTDIFYDTRQSGASNGIREGHFYLYPDNVSMDANQNDVNASPSFHMLNIQTRIKGDISGPDAFGAKTSGVIEAEFFGTNEADINGFRLRHAFVKMDWSTSTLVVGQSWHPMFTAESFPGTLSFNTGAPFIPFSRNPQVKYTRVIGDLSVSVTAYAQRDFTSPGPDGNSNKYLRNSGMPGTNLQLRLAAGDILTGWAGVDYKKIRPELRTSANVKTDASIGSFSFFSNLKIKTTPVTVSLMGVYGQNASDLTMIGGYAVTGITDLVNDFKEYTNINTSSFWIDMTTNGKKVAAGLFAGYSKNLGASKEISGNVYGRGNNIDHLFRISPRVTFTEGRLAFGAEVESTTAAYGSRQVTGEVINTENVINTRILFSTIYRF